MKQAILFFLTLIFMTPAPLARAQKEGHIPGVFASTLRQEYMNFHPAEEMHGFVSPLFESNRYAFPSMGPSNRSLSNRENDGAGRLYDPAPAWSEDTGGVAGEALEQKSI